MKHIFTLFLSIVIIGFASGQSHHTKRKHKSAPQKDTVQINKSLVVKQDKSSLSKDTIDKNKIPLLHPETVLDTLFVETGKLKSFKKEARASYYADKFNGKKTTSGKRFDNNKYTAAHKKLPFGTKVKVTNLVNGKSVIVEVIDRGPFVRTREIDLSKRAFMEIASNKTAGNMRVKIEIIE